MSNQDLSDAVDEVVDLLRANSNPDTVAYKQKKFGIVATNALGVFQKEINIVAKQIGKDSILAMALFDTEIYEARLLASKIFRPKDLTTDLIEKWSAAFDNWEICDSFSMGVYSKSAHARFVIQNYSNRKSEFERRTAFATMASYCMADKKASNEVYESFFPLLIEAATDERIYVKKAVNWALRSIGKRNQDLREAAISLAEDISKMKAKSAKWIASDAIRELQLPNVRVSDYPRSIYRPE